MGSLDLYDVPDDVIEALTEAVAALRTTTNAQAIAALRRGLGLDRAAVIEDIQRNRPTVDVDIAELIRSDRPAAS